MQPRGDIVSAPSKTAPYPAATVYSFASPSYPTSTKAIPLGRRWDPWSEGPLTTIFTPLPYCSNILYTFADITEDRTSFFVRGTARFSDNRWVEQAQAECYPPNWWFPLSYDGALPLYSPGVCPIGYVAANATSFIGGYSTYCCPRYAQSLS